MTRKASRSATTKINLKNLIAEPLGSTLPRE